MANTSIGKASGDGVISPSSEVWNISDGFMKIKVLRLMIQLDLDETIATFGRKDMEEFIDVRTITQRRIEALHRMVFGLRQLIGNCKFTIENKDQKTFDKLMKRIWQVQRVIGGISFIIKNDVTKEDVEVIDEYHFRKCLNILRDIKDEINVPINKAGLIFRKTDEVNLDDLMRNVIEGN